MEMVFRQRFTKLMFPLRDKVCRCSHICVKQSAFFQPSENGVPQRASERASEQARESSSKHLLIYLFMGHHLYSCYRIRIPNKRLNVSRLFTIQNRPKSADKNRTSQCLYKIKTKEKKKERNVDDVCWMIFTKQQRFVTLNDTPRNKLVSMKKQSENGNSYSPSSNKKKSIERCTVLNKWKDGTRCHFFIRQF